MPDCRHESLKYVGEQKTDDGRNMYYSCTSCGMVLVVTPGNSVVGIAGRQTNSEND